MENHNKNESTNLIGIEYLDYFIVKMTKLVNDY